MELLHDGQPGLWALTMRPHTMTQSSVTHRRMSSAQRSRLWRHTLGPLVAVTIAAWMLGAAFDAVPASAWLVVR